ncbi:MAG: M23 family metallopeptidase [Bacteroides graminisolvens]|jgi:murein DD-endopeptidase MepM/ murein hydrolase activator NlpD|uniref:Cell wall endopeptidase, family M23/M37 n=1 Tax=Bacteroides graminisolvens DSM 19988 = JCM 15093 TaxID=1121097 RepID=A0A069D464_9BACE|nr:M23 family metallopeptidase [Bacteroides graminisolvens]MBP6069374.1 M23 family metallopeptidase [Bacteroides sp.]MBP6248344.1 M23 family metallopeptidase [Bacteroides sp.]MBP9495522.1 M23 family metallopeptidase [Bacteroides sp.]MCD8541868.1 M23 family metallopeptidase [Bacteroides graminisolvens]GAK37125.1 cell wall endopeptidase, family M23/M37 [Bacteroides graminisolvens DSM 19988 = JCM 15093]
MKQTFVLTLLLVASVFLKAQEACPEFSSMEINHIRVATPGLFASSGKLILHIDSLVQMANFAFPLPGAKIISNYGSRGGHSGVDIKTCPNDTIYSAFNGIVRMSKPYSAYGKVIVVRHPGGLETVYSHNSVNFVKSGDVVKAGQPIALTGRTGRATTAHLHFETRINGQHFNPNLIFNINEGTLRKACLQCIKKGNKVRVKSL